MSSMPKSATPPAAPKPGHAVDGIPFLNDETRPKAPRIPGVTPAQRAQGRRLGHYHRHHLNELVTVRVALDRFLNGMSSAEAISEIVASLSMIENYRAFGNLCGNQCQLLEMHHTIEDRSIFPRLMQDKGLRPVVERLAKEHLTVHALIERLLDISRAVAHSPSHDAIVAMREVYEVFERVVMSHFKYEETELEEALGFYGIPL
ncbi:hypothetical protein EON79_23830 [bacterium]|nr:MAG: hypothetical protein EON79_23830 [bacterium]